MERMKREPTHPGVILKEDYLVPLEISVTEMAERLGISRKTLSKILNEKGSITPNMSLRLSRLRWSRLSRQFSGPTKLMFVSIIPSIAHVF